MSQNNYSFFSLAFRMKNIRRWGLMRSVRPESLTEHCAETAIIAHALALIGNKYFKKSYDAEHVMALALYHDICEVYTGDMPTPVKYFNPQMRDNYKKIEQASAQKLLSKLPDELSEEYFPLVASTDCPNETQKAEHLLVKAADKLSALIKCAEETAAGNYEFKTAYESTKKALESLQLEEANYFCEHFLPGFSLTLDEM